METPDQRRVLQQQEFNRQKAGQAVRIPQTTTSQVPVPPKTPVPGPFGLDPEQVRTLTIIGGIVVLYYVLR